MKKLIITFFLVLFLVGCACSIKGGAKESVVIFLEQYKSLDKDLIDDMDNYVNGENLNEEQKKQYREIFLKQYKDLSYEINSETYENDVAVVDVTIEVYDLFEAQEDAENYLLANNAEFLNESGEYDADKFINYKLEYMTNYKKRVKYDITLKVVDKDGMWTVEQPSKEVLDKIHGIYNN